VLERLFQHAFAVAKQVRTETQIGANPISVAFAAVSLARQIFGDLQRRTALMIGAGETIELVTKHLHTNGIQRVIVANRSIDRARELVAPYRGDAIGIPEIPERLPEADIVISSTASPLPILGKGATERALKSRKHRPIFMVDLAVPRDIEPEVGDLNDVYLYTVDDLEDVIEESRRSRQEAADEAEQIIELQVTDFTRWLRAQNLLGTLKTYRDSSCEIRDEVLIKAQRMLAAGKAPEDALEFLANTLTNKLIHQPTVQLNKAAHDGREELLVAARELLGLPKE
jgi:glutamyl-tRNA reductase